jgi:protein tyrosine phosphatase (PTP) superfamily phosphohydrolase (DUF442 family)
MKSITIIPLITIFFALVSFYSNAQTIGDDPALQNLKNFQVNTPTMVSAGLPNQAQFEALKANGVFNVIDLIPGDRSEESKLMSTLELQYQNIAVEWDNPTLENFDEYIIAMQQFEKNGGVILTHCKLNWRGAVFTYLYRVTQLNEPEAAAKKDLDATWQPNKTWQRFIDDIKEKYPS